MIGETNTKFTGIEKGWLVITAFALGFALAIRLMIAYYDGVFNISYTLLLDATIWFLLTANGVFFLNKNTEKDLLSVAIAFPIFVFTILGVMLSDEIACIFQKLFGADKTEVIKTLGWGISGIIAIYGFTVLNRRATAQDEANKLTGKGLSQERFKAAIDRLSNKESLAHAASFYEFFYLAKDAPDYAENILSLLCAHLRHTSNDEESKQEITEQQTLIDILFSSKAKEIFGNFSYDLRRAKLRGIDFQKIHKPEGEVDFSDANLSEAILNNADLSNFNFQNATLQNAEFGTANLQKSQLFSADLSGANLSFANLSGAMLFRTNFSGANLSFVNLSNAKLFRTNFSDADLSNANLSNADLSNADLSSADFSDANFRGADLFSAKNLETAELSGAEYGKSIKGYETEFPKGFNPEDYGMVLCSLDDNDDKK